MCLPRLTLPINFSVPIQDKGAIGSEILSLVPAAVHPLFSIADEDQSTDTIRASDSTTPHQQAGHKTLPDLKATPSKKMLATREPSTQDPSSCLVKILNRGPFGRLQFDTFIGCIR